MLSAKEKSLLAALEPRAAAEGIEVVTVEVVGSRKAPTIRVYLDTREGGITFDEVTQAQAWVDEIIEKLDPFPGAYTLEVSSPGIDRPLRTPEHFARFAGDEAYVVTDGPIDGRSRFTGELVGFDEDAQSVLMDIEGQQMAIPYTSIKKAHVKGVVEFR